MGKVGSLLFGKKPTPEQSSSVTGNHAYDSINSAFSPNFGFTSGAGNMLASLLGVGGTAGQTDALNNFANSAGMQFLRDQGNNQVNSNQAAKGLLQSGDTLKELTKYGQGLGSTYLNDYIKNLGTLGNLGLASGALVSDAGRYGTSKSSGAKPGKQGILPTLLTVAGTAVGGPAGGAAGSALGSGLGSIFGGGGDTSNSLMTDTSNIFDIVGG
jgi:hypothetical protein